MEETTPEVAPETTGAAPEKKQVNAVKAPGNIQGAHAYVPFLFIVAALQKLDDKTLMFHAKNGAGLTLLFIAASFVSAWLHVGIGGVLMFIWLIPAIIGAFHGFKNEKWNIPGVSSWSQNIPLDKWFATAHEENVEDEIKSNFPTEASTAEAPMETPVAAPTEPVQPTQENNNPNNPNL